MRTTSEESATRKCKEFALRSSALKSCEELPAFSAFASNAVLIPLDFTGLLEFAVGLLSNVNAEPYALICP